MKKRPIIFDCDPGHDDAIALVMALACPDWDIRAITTVGGNNTIQNVTNNALRILEVTGRTEIPVASGQAAPFLRELVQTGKFHGRTGMDGHSLPAPTITPVSEDAVGLMADILEKSETPVTLLVTGVFTNIATLLLSYPHLKQKISEISIMGGSYYRGNWSPVAEFNVWADPEAAAWMSRIRPICGGMSMRPCEPIRTLWRTLLLIYLTSFQKAALRTAATRAAWYMMPVPWLG